MSTFTVPVVQVRAIEAIPDADRIEVAVIGEFRSIVAKGYVKPGDLAVYIPEQSLVPPWLIEELGLTGKLHGPEKNRVKAMRMRGVLSQGLVYAPKNSQHCRADGERMLALYAPDPTLGAKLVVLNYGDDVADLLGIKKNEVVVPAHFRGDCVNVQGHTVRFDLENWKHYPDLIPEGEEVVITEKLHGTFVGFGWNPNVQNEELENGSVLIYSKGLGAKGLVFKNTDANQDNIYVSIYNSFSNGYRTIGDDLREYSNGEPIFIFGEIFGAGVQDLTYGYREPIFCAFAAYIGDPRDGGKFLDYDDFIDLVDKLGVGEVPLLYRGPFSKEILLQLTDGKTVMPGGHIREGVVVTPVIERVDRRLGRVSLKNVSGDYLTRKGNVTEFN